jgi:hypothetical protein
MPNTPTDIKLYNSVKARVYKSNPVHSAYRSGHVVQAYKRAFAKKHGSSRSPYRSGGNRSRSRSRGNRSRSRSRGNRSRSRSRSTGLGRWFAERWRNQRGEIGYKYKGDVYRPTRRVTKKTPTTFKELSPRRLNRARSEKKRTGRVSKF